MGKTGTIRSARMIITMTTTFGALGFAFQNCSMDAFSIDVKNRKLSTSPVFSYAATGTIAALGDGSDPASGALPTEGNGSASGSISVTGGSGMPTLPGGRDPEDSGGSIPTATTTSIPIHFGCSTRRSQEEGNIAEASSLTVKLTVTNDETAPAACSFTEASLRQTVLQTKTIPLSLVDAHCPSLADGKYFVFVSDSSRANSLNWTSGNRTSTFTVQKKSSGSTATWKIQANDFLTLITDYNSEARGGLQHAMLLLKPDECDIQSSPLMMRFETAGSAPARLTLTSPADGVLFDILGANATPAPYTARRISWIRNEAEFYFIALPNSSGQVKGIDQLFGDNTKGPDGEFAANGFLALEKYDLNHDGAISAADPVYAKLRLWRDDNGDGVGQTSELRPLVALGVASIDLRYDPHYHEADPYGNEIKFKSVVRTTDGRLHIIFDLWFAHN